MEDHGGNNFRDRIATVGEDGKRIWIFPKMPNGWFHNKRKIVSIVLLTLLFGLPHVKIAGEQALFFGILEKKFVIFGKIFWPQDMYLLAVALIIGILFVIVFTTIYGRLFCGWVCPQTVFMEMLFRKIEYWIEGDATHQKKLAKQVWNGEKIRKRLLKHSIFWILSFAIANTFLAYIIGSDQLWQIQHDPIGKHVGGLLAIAVFTTAFYLVFSRLREQVCTTICPYGRLQGVLLDKNSMVVAYDYIRGEKRAKFKKDEVRATVGKGDCIDCSLCVQVCPTGIDIRNGTQLECTNCTACMDACDQMMVAVKQEKGLIRYVSEEGIKNRTRFTWTRRVKSYTALLVLMLGVFAVLLFTRKDFQTNVTRQRGTTYQMTGDGRVSNIFEVYLLNKTRNEYKVTLRLEGSEGEIETVVEQILLPSQQEIKERFVVKLPFGAIKNGKKDLRIEVWANGKVIDHIETKFIGPSL